MANTQEITFNISYSESGTFAASSSREPYFFFEANTEEEARNLAVRALNFYYDCNGRVARQTRVPVDSKVVRSRVRKQEVFRAVEAA